MERRYDVFCKPRKRKFCFNFTALHHSFHKPCVFYLLSIIQINSSGFAFFQTKTKKMNYKIQKINFIFCFFSVQIENYVFKFEIRLKFSSCNFALFKLVFINCALRKKSNRIVFVWWGNEYMQK